MKTIFGIVSNNKIELKALLASLTVFPWFS